MDDYLPTALVIVLSVNLLLFLGQASIIHIATEAGETGGSFYEEGGSLLCRFDKNACAGTTYDLSDDDPAGYLPSSEAIEADDGGLFTDMFASIKRFFTDTLGLGYLTDLLSAPKVFLSVIGLPNEVAWALGALWYGFTLFVIVAFFWGR